MALGAAGDASATQITATWNGGAGNWNNAAQWSFSSPPAAAAFPNNDLGNNDFFDVRIDGGNGAASPVTVNVPVAIDSLDLDGDDGLGVSNSSSLRIVRNAGRAGSGNILNDGNIGINSLGSNTDLIFDGGTVNLGGDGTGTVTLDDSSNLGRARLRGVNGAVLNNLNNTIQGEGEIGLNSLEVRNQAAGVIDANVSGQRLTIDPNLGGVTNAGTLRASNQGILRLNGGTIANTGGTIEALASSSVELVNGVRVAGGTLTGAGTFVNANTASLDGVGTALTLDGVTFTQGNATTTTLFGAIDLDNGTTMAINSNGSNTDLLVDGTVTLGGDGTGVVTLNDTSNLARARIRGQNAGVLVNDGNTLQGEGQIGLGSMGLRNQNGGLVDANVGGQSLTIDPSASGVINSATMRASGGGRLVFSSGSVDNTGGTIEAQAGSSVAATLGVVIGGGNVSTIGNGTLNLAGATIQGGTTSNGVTGLVDVTAASTLSGVFDNAAGGQLSVRNAASLTLDGNGTYNNAGNMQLDSNGSLTDLIVDGASGNTTLSGGGTLTLNDTSNLARARVRGVNGGVLVNQSHTIQGEGLLGSASIGLQNLAGGLVDANVNGQRLFLQTSVENTTNTGVLRASNGGTLQLNAGVVTNTGGTIEAQAASTVELTGGVTIAGGTLTGVGSIVNTSAATLDGVGLTIDDGSFVTRNAATTTLIGNIGLVNSAAIALDSNGTNTDLLVDGTVTLGGDGTGTVTLDDTSNLARARIRGQNTGVLVNVNNTIQGEGQIGVNTLELRNQAAGIIDANVSGQRLIVDANASGVTNTGTLRASSQGILQLSTGTITNTGGAIEALASSSVELTGGVRVAGGTLTGAGTFVNANTATLDGIGMTLDGATFTQGNSTTTTLFGAMALDNGTTMAINSNGTNTDFLVDGTVTLGGDGSGVVTLDDTSNLVRARIRGQNAGVLVNAGNTLQGEGQIGVNSMGLVNQAGGVVHANVNGQSLILDPNAAGVTNTGTLRASGGGRLLAQGGAFDSSGGTVEALDAGLVQFAATAAVQNIDGAGNLTAGTWRAVDGGSGATLRVDSALSTIGNIGAGAAVELSGAASAFTVNGATLDATLATNQGSFSVRGGRVFSTAGGLVNDGTVTAGGAGTRLDVAGVYTQNSGQTILDGAILDSQGGSAVFNGGSLSGSGTVNGGAVFGAGASIGPGFSPGILDFGGDTVFDGLIQIELLGLNVDGGLPNAAIVNTATDPATTQFDQLNVFGAADLLDTLTLDIALGFSASNGDFFDVITADLLNVDLGAITLLLPTDFSASVVTLSDPLRGNIAQALRLTFDGAGQPVPAPGTLLLLLAGVVGVAHRRRVVR